LSKIAVYSAIWQHWSDQIHILPEGYCAILKSKKDALGELNTKRKGGHLESGDHKRRWADQAIPAPARGAQADRAGLGGVTAHGRQWSDGY
jgi:hypothetical protein